MARKLYLGLFGLILIGLIVAVTSRLIVAAVYLRQGRLDNALIKALERRDLVSTKALLEQGANANARERLDHPQDGWRRLWDDVSGHRAQAKFGMHALFIAEENDDIPATAVLLKHGADPNTYIRDDDLKYSVLMRSAVRAKLEIVQLLVQHGADVKSEIGPHISILDMAQFGRGWSGPTDTIARKRYDKVIQVLKQAGAR
jgi:hypothetical protein